MEKGVLFLDTNVVNNKKSFRDLFGNREALTRLSKSYEIKIAKVVYDELLRHKRDEFEAQILQLRKNAAAKLLGIDTSKAETFDFQKLVDGLHESIPFEICEMEPADAFMREFYPLAVDHKAPFEPNSDKGFKDACVMSAIRKYLQDHKGCEPVHFVTADKRLRESFAGKEMVVVHESLAGLLELEYGEDDKAHKASGPEVPTAYGRKADASMPSEVWDAVDDFCGSTSFPATHKAVEALEPYVYMLDDGAKVRLLKASVTNFQISWVLKDRDVKALMDPIFAEAGNRLSDEEYYQYVDAADLPNNRLDDNGNVQFSRMERQVYKEFVDDLLGHIRKVNWDYRFVSDSEQILKGLTDLLAASTLEPMRLTWEAITSLFVTSGITVEDSSASSKTVRDFRNFLKDSSAKKRDAILSFIRGRLDMVASESD